MEKWNDAKILVSIIMILSKEAFTVNPGEPVKMCAFKTLVV
jgi:hypothetical protein